MYYVYVLLSDKDQQFYIGITSDLKRRLQTHHDGDAASTKPRRPLQLLFYEAHCSKLDALWRERYFKTQKGKRTLRQMLRHTLEQAGDSG